MVFSSTIFLFCFLPLTLVATILARPPARNFILLAASLLFYAWGEQALVLLMIASIAGNYLFGLAVARSRGRLLMAAAVAFNLGLLGFFKYANFFVDSLNMPLGALGLGPLQLEPVHLPIGISFFTFQALSYVIDIRRGQSRPQKNPLNVALYIALFPQLIAGPIVRYHSIARQLVSRSMNVALFAEGIKRFIIGLGKKVLIANTMAGVADEIFALPSGELTGGLAWLGILAYTLQIYFDFSGYSDMAIGLGRMFGFDFPENFAHPYIARSIREFWRRWHISLSSWFRDYLYIPMGGNRRGPLRTYCNLLIVFFLVGLWHGASWTFVFWGLFHGLFIILERAGLDRVLDRLWSPLRHAYTMLVVMVGWVFFRADDFGFAWSYLLAMFGRGRGAGEIYSLPMYLDNKVLLMTAIGLVCATPVFSRLQAAMACPRDSTSSRETSSRETSGRETSGRETSSRETSVRETSSRECPVPATSNPDTSVLASTGRVASIRDTSIQDTSIQDTPGPDTRHRDRSSQKSTTPAPSWLRTVFVPAFYMAIYLLCVMSLAGGTYNPFIYFRF